MNRIQFVFIIAAISLIHFNCEKKATSAEHNEKPRSVPAPPKNDRPNLPVALVDGQLANLKYQEQKMLLVLFQPECDDCQREITQIRANIEAFGDYQLFFVSSHPVNVLKKFANDYKLADVPNAHFGQVAVESVIANFGQIVAPSLFIYDSNGKLIKSFKGETDINLIKQSL
jgi:peroxiredoxin